MVDAFFSDAQKATGAFPWVVRSLGELDKEAFARMADAICDAIRDKNLATMVVVIGAKVGDKALFAAGAGQQAVKDFAVHCGDLVKTAAQKAGGGGGGSPMRAQAGGKDPAKLGDALKAVELILTEKAGKK
jgi:alanyl-tRNA synthetase